jgi:hypothetical protein
MNRILKIALLSGFVLFSIFGVAFCAFLIQNYDNGDPLARNPACSSCERAVLNRLTPRVGQRPDALG